MASDLATNDAAIETAVRALSWGSGVTGAFPGDAEWRVEPRDIHWRAEILYPSDSARMSVAGSGVTGNAITGTLRVKVKQSPVGSGLATLKAKADIVRTYFSRRLVGSSFFFAPSGARHEIEKNWDAVVVDCPFEVREA